MPRLSALPVRLPLRSALSIAVLLAAGCTSGSETEVPPDVTVFEGGRVIVGDGSAPIEDAILVVEGDRITVVGSRAAVTIPAGATTHDLSGKTVIPAIVNAHVHLSNERAERTEQLQQMAYYGAGTVISLGHDSGDVAFAMRDEVVPNGARGLTAGRGITSREPGRSEVPYWVTTEDEARSAVRELAAANVDFVKIWVDDRNGQFEKLSPELYGAVIDEAHASGLRVTAHIYSLEDAKGLLRAGVDAFAHSVRDRDVDDELVDLWREHPDVVLVPNLPNPGVAMDLSWLSATVPEDQLQQMQEAAVDRPEAQERFAIQARNLKRLSDAGIPIAFGTDGSAAWAVHLEMEDMVRAGLTPMQVITAATSTSAQLLGVTDVGALASGMMADFVVLDANPLDDITNARRIDAVYLRGERIDRDAPELTPSP